MIARYLVAGCCACMLSITLQAQSLDTLVSENSMDWMFGQWQGQNDKGDAVTLDVSWDLNKHLAILHVKTSEMEAKGYTVLVPHEEKPQYYSVDNKGGVGKGSWDREGDQAILRVEMLNPDRDPWKAAFVFGGSASTGLQIKVHGIDSSGELTPPKATYKLKKK